MADSMSNTNDLLQQLSEKEGCFSDHPADTGGRTDGGISEKWNPDLWADGKVTDEERRKRYVERYVLGPGFDKIQDYHLMSHLVDFGVNSGPATAIMALQRILEVDVDGVIGPQTLGALASREIRSINNLLVAERVKMLGRIVTRAKNQLVFLNHWLQRAVSWIK